MKYRDECQNLWQTETQRVRWLKGRGWVLNYSNNPDWATLTLKCKSGNEWVCKNPKGLLQSGSCVVNLVDQWGRELGDTAPFTIPA